ncbi:MAG: nitroreductase family protein [Anaerolineae bacterium]|jgi:nitroreductase|nr:nitroreductase family protein [Anaerolineae bacterium]
MDFWEVIAARHSVREFDPRRDVPAEFIRRILEAAVAAPSAGNRQPWHFFVVREARTRTCLAAAAYGQIFVSQAPVVIVVCAEPDRSAARYGYRGKMLYCLQDTAAATEHILLAATALGLGACWVGAFDEDEVSQCLALSPSLRPVALVPIGYPAHGRPAMRSRRPLSEVVTFIE